MAGNLHIQVTGRASSLVAVLSEAGDTVNNS